MRLEPFALSTSHFISSVGADAGFASIIGLAILVLLYFAQARETASLRDQAELAAQRIAQLENRLAHAVSAQPQTGAAAVAPPPGMPRPAGVIPVPGGQPAPVSATAAAPPAGVAAPPLSAATKLIPTPPPIAAPGFAAARIAAPAAASVNAPFPAAATLPPASTTPANRIVTPRPATAAGGATAGNGLGEHSLVPPPIPVPPAPPRGPVVNQSPLVGSLGNDKGRGAQQRDLSRVLTAIAVLAVLAAIVIVLISLTGGSTPRATSGSTPTTNAPKPAHHAAAAKAKPVNPASVTVGVLNGTAVYHLANSVGGELAGVGFKEGTIADAANQQESTTSVQYVPGAQRDAAAVARALKLPPSAVQPITPDTQALGCPQTGACSVVVTVGSDLASSGTQTQTTG